MVGGAGGGAGCALADRGARRGGTCMLQSLQHDARTRRDGPRAAYRRGRAGHTRGRNHHNGSVMALLDSSSTRRY